MSGTEEFTLLGCVSVRSENIGFELPGPRVQEFAALYTLEWCAVERPDPAVTSIYCRLDVLDTWAQPTEPLEETNILEEHDQGGFATHLVLRWPPPLTVDTPIGLLSVSYPPDFSTRFGRSEYSRCAMLGVQLAEPVLLSRLFYDVLGPIRSFIAFATASDLSFTSIQLTVSENTADMETSGLWCACDPLNANNERSPMDDDQAEEACRHGYFMLHQIEDSLGTVWTRWFQLHDQAQGPIYTLLAAMDHNSGRHVSDLFQSVAFAAEAMHRALGYAVESDVSENEAKRLRHRIREQLLPEHRRLEWLQGRIAHIADTPYVSRLNALFEKCPPMIRDAAGSDFPLRVTRARNNAAHLATEVTTSSDELHRLYSLLILVLSACIMLEIGLSPEAVSTHIRYSDRFWELIRRGAVQSEGHGDDEVVRAVPGT